MRRVPEDLVPPPVQPQARTRVGDREIFLVDQVREYEIITPLFGGGVEPGKADPVTTVRGSTIRGHLRFWWRACRGGRSEGNLTRLRQMEAEIWGAAGAEKTPLPSKVDIAVEVRNSGSSVKPYERARKASPRWRTLAYAAFPLQDVTPVGEVLEGVTFVLKLRFPEELREEVEATLWAWETFGGLGARTRRGFGALKLLSVDGVPADLPTAERAERWIRERLGRYVAGNAWPCGVPNIGRDSILKVTGPHDDVRQAWEYLIDSLRKFRQSRQGGSRAQRPGRSVWPEPDAIRNLTGRSFRRSDHAPAVEAFPRAAFGLPIVFHFKDENRGDPRETVLTGACFERLASPLIIRPLACRDKAVGLAVILAGTGLGVLPAPLKLVEQGDNGRTWTVRTLLRRDEAKRIAPLRGEPDVLKAFLNSL